MSYVVQTNSLAKIIDRKEIVKNVNTPRKERGNLWFPWPERCR